MNYWVSDKLGQGDVKQEFMDGTCLSWWISLLGLLPFRVGSVGGVSAGALLVLTDCRLRLPATVGTVIVTVVLLVEWDRSRHRLLLIVQCLASALKFSYTEGLKVSTHKLSEFDYILIGRVFFNYYFILSVRNLMLSSVYLSFTIIHCLTDFSHNIIIFLKNLQMS